jgi:hypothetical protein
MKPIEGSSMDSKSRLRQLAKGSYRLVGVVSFVGVVESSLRSCGYTPWKGRFDVVLGPDGG